MNDSVAITTSSLAITEKKPQRPGGCVGIFFQLFDWNRRFAKNKLFPGKLLSPGLFLSHGEGNYFCFCRSNNFFCLFYTFVARLKQASKKFGGDEKQPKLRLIANENSGGFPNGKNNGNTCTRSESKREMRAPSLVARLMGLESMPAGACGKSKKAPVSQIGSNEPAAEKIGARPTGSNREDMNCEKAEIKCDLRPEKLQKIGVSERRPVSRFSAEALQLKTVLSRPRKHQPKLASPVKSPRNVSSNHASRLIGAATRILEPGLHKSRAKCALPYPKPSCQNPQYLEGSSCYVNSEVPKTKPAPSCKNCGHLLQVKSGAPNVEDHQSSVPSYSEPSCQGPGRNMPKLPIFGTTNQRERVSESSASDAAAELDDVSYCAQLILGKRPISRNQREVHVTRQGSNVKNDVSAITHARKTQKQNQIPQSRDRGVTKSNSSSLQSIRVLASAESMNVNRNYAAQNRRLSTSTRLKMPAASDSSKFEAERKPYLRRNDSLSPVRKKRSMNFSRQGESSTFPNAGPCSEQTSGKDAAFPISCVDRNSSKPMLPLLRESKDINDTSKGSDIVSFRFNSVVKHKTAEVTKRKSQYDSSFNATLERSFFKGSDERTGAQKSIPLKGDILGALLEEKLKELTCQDEEFAESRKSAAMILQELITALTADKQFQQDNFPVRPSRKEDSCDYGYVPSRHTCTNFQAYTVGSSLDIDHHSPGCVLEAAFSNDSYPSSSPNSSSRDKLLADSIDDEQLFPKPNGDLLDCAISLSTQSSCGELITDCINNISAVLSKIAQLKGSKLSHAKEVILNCELIFGITPQLVLLLEEDFSVNRFLLNELEMLSSFLWMTFGQLLGCNDQKQMNHLKGFAFDCVIEYLDSKFGQYSNSGFRTWIKRPSGMNNEILVADVIEEVKAWTEFVGLIPDELIAWDMSHGLGKWRDFEMEAFECGTEVDRHILQVLVDEVVLDLCSCS